MRTRRRHHRLAPLALAFGLGLGAGSAAAAGAGVSAENVPPRPRVMSLNVCTDQLVLALADPEQIISLSNLSDDPGLSFLHEQAAAYPKNAGLAEEVFVMRPDVVVTGTYSLHTTTAVIAGLGLRVEEFPFTQTLDTIPGDIRRMGAVLGQGERAEQLAADFERELAAPPASAGHTPTVVVLEQNGVVPGAGTLTDSVLQAAGFRNLAAEHGLFGMAPYPLELLVADRPDLVLTSRVKGGAPALADQVVRHPAVAALGTALSSDVVPAGAWSCGGPFTIEAVHALRQLRDRMPATRGATG